MEISLIIVTVLLILSVLASKISDRFGIPVLLLFLSLGMLAGSEGIGGIYFDNPDIAQTVSIIALVLILFSGGLQTKWSEAGPVKVESWTLATLGTLMTAVIVGLFAKQFLGLTLLEGLLLGSMMSSTDAAAVFSVLRSKGVSLKGKLKPLLELESGSNDPMAVFLTVGMILLIQQPDKSPFSLILLFIQQMAIGALLGYLMGRLVAYVLNKIKLGYIGLYPVMSLAFVLLTFGIADVLNGSGFLAVYFMGIVMNNVDMVHKRTLQRFHDGVAWLMQIAMFIILGLFIYPSELVKVAGVSLLVAIVLIFIARPISVFLTLLFRPITFKEKTFISWVGLRGAAPIILATFPMFAGIEKSGLYFNVIFFIVLTSVLLQGTTIPLVARWLKLDKPIEDIPIYPIEYQPVKGMHSELTRLFVPQDSNLAGKALKELMLPENFLITLIERDDEFIVPKGGTVIYMNDTLLVLTDDASLSQLTELYSVIILELD